jgi:hypothetical protein
MIYYMRFITEKDRVRSDDVWQKTWEHNQIAADHWTKKRNEHHQPLARGNKRLKSSVAT